ncbi:MAG: amidohydrolase family protein, partial [Xanthomonadales bacterium]|nr:amidohydrolase family protein [Xanthomonadales bacterium]
MVVLAVAALACGFSPAVVAQDMEAATVRIVHCGRLLDVAEEKVLLDRAVTVTGNRITSIEPAGEARPPTGAETIDLGGFTCLPGLIDAHTHLVDRSEGEDYNWARPLMTSGAEMALWSLPNARKTLLAGFTTVRDMGTYRAFVDVA